MKKLLISMASLLTLADAAGAHNLQLRYNRPASDWMSEALPIGNGHMGAMVYGGVESDTIQLSEKSIWSGGPNSTKQYCYGNRDESHSKLPAIRALLEEKNNQEAINMAQQHFTGKVHDAGLNGDFGAQQPWGNVIVELVDKNGGKYTDYSRELDIEQSVSTTRFERGGVTHHNEFFASYPGNVVVARYSNDSGADYIVKFQSPHKLFSSKLKGDVIKVTGKLESNGMIVEGDILIKTDGKISDNGEGAIISSAGYVELYTTIGTNYKNEYPTYVNSDKKQHRRLIDASIANARKSGYEDMKRVHQADYKNLFDRVGLTLGSGSDHLSDLPTDERLYRYCLGASDHGLESLYFQYGRYLLISSSREGALPAHLQGVWNNSLTPPWTCDYHFNINIEMIYWPAEVANLSECHKPLLQYINSLRQPGSVTAREYFNARGWVVNTINNPFGYTAPGWDFKWGYAPNSSAWLCDHLWKHYAFTGDSTYLKEFAYPVMKEVGQFWIDYLHEDTDGTLVSTPSYSPEHGNIAIGSMIDQEIAYDLFSNLLEAGDVVGDQQFLDTISFARGKLSPLRIGRYGQLQEWKEDIDDPNNNHRHVSHLYALYPGRQITPQHTPELAKAARRSLVYRGEGGTGWSLGWKINFWARLLDGNQSYKMIRNLLTPALGKKNLTGFMDYYGGSGSYGNLLCSHPPFQLDGNMGAVSGMCEMMIQSHNGYIDILPAIPSAWSDGSVKGLRAQGNYTVDIEWKDGLLQKAVVVAGNPGSVELRYKGEKLTISFDRSGQECTITMNDIIR